MKPAPSGRLLRLCGRRTSGDCLQSQRFRARDSRALSSRRSAETLAVRNLRTTPALKKPTRIVAGRFRASGEEVLL